MTADDSIESAPARGSCTRIPRHGLQDTGVSRQEGLVTQHGPHTLQDRRLEHWHAVKHQETSLRRHFFSRSSRHSSMWKVMARHKYILGMQKRFLVPDAAVEARTFTITSYKPTAQLPFWAICNWDPVGWRGRPASPYSQPESG